MRPAFASFLAAAALIGGCAHAPGPGAKYVAMGSSFAAGPGLGEIKPDTPVRCTRSANNYATLLSRQLGLRLTDASCSGATTAHLLGRWAELAPQLDAITPDTALVTVTIGGNDVGYVRNLMAASCRDARRCPPATQSTEAEWAAVERNMITIAREVHRRAPRARLVFVDYLTLLPARGNCPVTGMSDVEVERLRQVGRRLAAVTARAAAAGKADLLPAGALSRGHSPCDATPWSVGASGTGPGTAWHPNARGMAAIAQALARHLR